MARTTVRTLSKVKSSAMMARQPSVPNVILLTGEKYKRRAWWREAAMWCGGWVGPAKLVGGFDVLGASSEAYSRDFCFFSSSHLTILETSWERLRGQRRIASSVSTKTRSRTPRAATNFFGDQKKFPVASRVRDGPAAKFPPGLASNS